jgi:hypothetical protein
MSDKYHGSTVVQLMWEECLSSGLTMLGPSAGLQAARADYIVSQSGPSIGLQAAELCAN